MFKKLPVWVLCSFSSLSPIFPTNEVVYTLDSLTHRHTVCFPSRSRGQDSCHFYIVSLIVPSHNFAVAEGKLRESRAVVIWAELEFAKLTKKRYIVPSLLRKCLLFPYIKPSPFKRSCSSTLFFALPFLPNGVNIVHVSGMCLFRLACPGFTSIFRLDFTRD